MKVVADAAPLIFLCKGALLAVLPPLFEGDIYVPSRVKKELLAPGVPPDEERALRSFLSRHCKVVEVKNPVTYAQALSLTDNCVLTLISRRHADVLLSDDRLLRKTALVEGIKVIGTIGVIIKATRASLVPADRALAVLDELVQNHGFRISTAVYSKARNALEDAKSSIEGVQSMRRVPWV